MKSNLSAKETLLYNDREKSEVVFINNLTGDNVFEVERQMAARQKLFTGRAKNLTAHIIISPSIEDGKKQTKLDWKEIGSSFLQKAGLSAYQSIAYLHKDKEHHHLHIVVNRIDKAGKIFRGGNELAMSQRLGDEIAIERGLTRAKEIRHERKLSPKEGVVTNGEIGSVAKMRKAVTKAAILAYEDGKFNPTKYFDEIKSNGYEVKTFFKKNGEGETTNEIRGYAMGKKGEHLINASQIGSELTLKRLERERPPLSNQSLPNVEPLKDVIRKDLHECFDKMLKNQKQFDSNLFLTELKLKGYSVTEYHNKDTGKLRGYAIEKDGVAFNSSELGSEFTLTNLKKRFLELTPAIDSIKKVPEQKTKTPKSNEEFRPDQADQISQDLKRTIDLTLISSHLKDLTSGHKYQSPNDFIKAIDEQGYHVHLRYDKGSLSGYTVHKGTEHYHDKEIDNGRFSLEQLVKSGLFRPLSFRNSPEVNEKEIPKTSVDDTPTETKIVSNNNSSDLVNQLFLEREALKKKESDKERARKIIASELRIIVHSFKNTSQPINTEKFFADLVTNGYDVTRHFNKDTNSLRGYSLKKYGFDFHASEIGREFTLKSLEETSAQKTNPSHKPQSKPRLA